MADIYGGFDFLSAGNALSQLQSGIQARQANALQMQYTAEDRARVAQERKAAAGNALADQARKRELLDIYSNFGVTPAVIGQRGQSYSGTGVANDPYADIQNKLLQKGFASEAGNVAELQNKNLTGKKTEAETEVQKATNKGLDIKNIDARLNLVKQFANSVTTSASAANFAQIMAREFPEFAELYGSPEDAAARSAELFDTDPAAWQAHSVSLTGEQLVQATERAKEAKTAKPVELDIGGRKIFVDMNPDSSTFKQEVTGFDKTLTPNEAATQAAEAKKLAWERANPEFTLQETAQGLVAVNKRNPNDVKPVQLGGQTLMPKVTPGQTININQIQESELEKSLGKGQGEIALKSQATAQDAADMINTIKIGRGLVQQGIVTGFGADFRVDLGRALKLAGIETGDDAVANTQTFAATMAQNVGKLIKQFGAGTGLSDADREYAIKMAGGQITLDESAIKKILDINERAAKNTIEQHNKKYGGIKTTVPLTVDVPSDITSNATNSTSVITPDGKTHNFPSLEAAAQFKKAAGIK